MAKTKQQTMFDRFANASFHAILFQPLVLAVALVAGLIGLSMVLWNQFQDRLLPDSLVRVQFDQIIVTSQPDWILGDVKKKAVRDSRLDQLSLFQTDLVDKVASAFAVQPWVREVHRVEKSPGGIVVDLSYREPVAMVEVGSRELIPVDGDGYVLEAKDLRWPGRTDPYWRISIVQPIRGPAFPGRDWPDLRVLGATRVADCLRNDQAQMHLLRVVSFATHLHDPSNLGPFEIWTRSNNRIVWGSPPGREAADEADAKAKLEALRAHLRTFGGFDGLEEGEMWDVRSGTLTRVPITNIALANDLLIRR